MQFAPGIQAAEWQTLTLDTRASPRQGTAVQILEGRIQERYFEPIDHPYIAEFG